ncbi:hypothetical protein D3C80_1697410 [compost metagenome]
MKLSDIKCKGRLGLVSDRGSRIADCRDCETGEKTDEDGSAPLPQDGYEAGNTFLLTRR